MSFHTSIAESKPVAGKSGWFQAEPGLGAVLAALGALLVFRLLTLWFSTAELGVDEAQYWAWSQELALGYFSKPPLIAFLIRGVTSVCGDSEFCVRLPAVVLNIATAFVLYLLACRMFDRRTGFWTAVTYALAPGMSLSSILMTTDVPLLLFWVLGMYALWRLIERPSIIWGLIFGLALGLGLNAKYAMAFLPACFILFAAFSPMGRRALAHPGFWLGIGVGALLIAPNIVWNFANDGVTYRHMAEDAQTVSQFPNWRGLGDFILSQAGIMGPVIGIFYLIGLFRRGAGLPEGTWAFLTACSLPIFLTFDVQAFIAKANGNWAAFAIPAAIALAVAGIMQMNAKRSLLATQAIALTVLLAVSVMGIVRESVTVKPFSTLLSQFDGWKELASEVEAAAQREGAKTIVLAGRDLTAEMLYYLRGSGLTIRTLAADPMRPENHFEMTRPYKDGDPLPTLITVIGKGTPEMLARFGAQPVGEVPTKIFAARRVGIVSFYLAGAKP